MDGRKKAERTRYNARERRIAGKIAANLVQGDTLDNVQIIAYCGDEKYDNGGVKSRAVYSFTPQEWKAWTTSRKRKDKPLFKGDDRALVGRQVGYGVADIAGRAAVTAGFRYVRVVMIHDAPNDAPAYCLHRASYLLPKMVDAVIAAVCA